MVPSCLHLPTAVFVASINTDRTCVSAQIRTINLHSLSLFRGRIWMYSFRILPYVSRTKHIINTQKSKPWCCYSGDFSPSQHEVALERSVNHFYCYNTATNLTSLVDRYSYFTTPIALLMMTIDHWAKPLSAHLAKISAKICITG